MEVAGNVSSVVSIGVDDDGDASFLSGEEDTVRGILFLTGFKPAGGIEFDSGTGGSGGIEDFFGLGQKAFHVGDKGKLFDQVKMSEKEEFAAGSGAADFAPVFLTDILFF